MKKSKTSTLKFLIPYLLVGIIVLVLIFQIRPKSSSKEEKNYTFIKLIEDIESSDKTFEEINITPKQTIIVLSGVFSIEENSKTVKYTFKITILNNQTNQTIISEKIINNGEIINYKISNIYESNVLQDILLQMLPYVILIIVGMYLLNRFAANAGGGNNKAFDFGKSKANLSHGSKVRFSDVAGSEEEKAELLELVEYLKSPDKFVRMGSKFPKGVILQGAPGTGKTLLAKAVAGEADVPFYFISGSDFVEMFVGVGASRVRDMFKTAKANRPCIVFIDEIDAVGRQRGAGLGGGNDEREQTLNQLLVELDGFEENSGILVIAATNRPDVLDPALLRPGRFDRQITVALPDKKARIEILKVHSRNKKISKSVNFENIAQRTPGFSGAQLGSVINEASILAVRRNKDIIDIDEIDEAIDRVIGGPARKSRIITPHEKKLIAYHESGHAVVGLKLEHSNIVQKVTIIPRGEAGGYVLMTPKDDQTLMTKGELLAKITGYLAGRVSEEIFFNDVTTGAQNDIEQATRIARIMVTELGMSKLGPIQYEKQTGSVFLGRDYMSNERRFSGQVAFEIDKEVRSIIDDCYQKAQEIVSSNKELLTLIAETLLNKETLTSEEILELDRVGNLDSFKVVVTEDQKEVQEIEKVEKEEENKKEENN